MPYATLTEIRYKPFTQLEDSDYENRNYSRSFSGKLTKQRYRKLRRFCKRNTFHTHCGHDWDCCGCLCAQGMWFTYRHNQVTVFLSQSFNY